MADSFYKKTTGTEDFYAQSSSGTEPNMRQELINTFDGSFPEIAKAQTGLLRRMRRTANGMLISCPCVDRITKEPDKDRFCPICLGEGYLWDEHRIQFYRTLEDSDVDNSVSNTLRPPGLINHPIVVFYIRYDAEITVEDKIITAVLNSDGTMASPLRREHVFRINTVWPYRSDYGKLEYYKVFAHDQYQKHLHAPTHGDL
jgi:hypothetical protein